MTEQERDGKRIAERKEIRTKIEFFVYGDIETATSVDISETGIRFETPNPIKVRMRLTVNGELKECMSQLVWAKRNTDNSMSYGLAFIPDDDTCIF